MNCLSIDGELHFRRIGELLPAEDRETVSGPTRKVFATVNNQGAFAAELRRVFCKP